MQMSRPDNAGGAGFTLIELLVVIAILGITAAIAIPQFKSITRNATLRAAARELYGQFQRAKIEAIKRNETVAIVFSSVGPDSYAIFTDPDDNRSFDAGETSFGVTRLPPGLLLENISFPNAATSFTAKGRPGGDFGGVDLKDSASGKAIRLTTTLAGYVHLANR